MARILETKKGHVVTAKSGAILVKMTLCANTVEEGDELTAARQQLQESRTGDGRLDEFSSYRSYSSPASRHHEIGCAGKVVG